MDIKYCFRDDEISSKDLCRVTELIKHWSLSTGKMRLCLMEPPDHQEAQGPHAAIAFSSCCHAGPLNSPPNALADGQGEVQCPSRSSCLGVCLEG